ncbi:antibiotic biosynthesis monooxygenase [Tumebacillus sp. ITR2]|uniref:Heme oxygenase (Staphylobilin-producing) n=2 Tax=Tumebacillus TaxID=432330 RepID=A0A316D570_9BACL|nr:MULTISPECIES: antibiotic biosynthesis monooxygenase family protein [Tumebacillus]MBL0388323.1 antibiotic biosynthesis monooxygenase [Tumebacillus amylolyticus]PWK08432.1 heme oxygenase (staphylobilin-producing) [Tumebacillus permanentifrigoris]
MFVSMNRLTVPAEYREHLEGRFATAGERMSQVAGCLEYQFLVPTEGDELVVYTKWEDEAAYKAWVESDSFTKAHANANPNSPVKGDLRLYNVKFSS